jgi:hypothetical protein
LILSIIIGYIKLIKSDLKLKIKKPNWLLKNVV